MKVIRLTDEQYKTLERLLEQEIDQEYIYQEKSYGDTELLEEYIDLYEAFYKCQAKSRVDALVINNLVESKKKLVEELKDERIS